MNRIGFTGTRLGMTEAQKATVRLLVEREVLADLTVAHHGDCIGADHDFHCIARDLGLAVVGHPPSDDTKRAFCGFDEERAPAQYMVRNRAIVTASDLMIATPAEYADQATGGTWRTIGMARDLKRPLVIVWPDGTTLAENGP